MAPVTCIICSTCSPCTRCIIKQLQLDNHKLKLQLQYYKKDIPEILTINSDYKKHFETSSFYLPFSESTYTNSHDFKFITITFDPSKFGLYNQDEPQKQYIYRSFHNALERFIINRITGCFEYQKNGSIHAHALIRTKLTTQELDDHFS
uniref:hypothetical protein n=1 Tax=Rheinheimera sp. TaxID=1869214 RepID=UPI0040480A85